MLISCPKCKNSIRLDDTGTGGLVKVACGQCGARLEVFIKKKNSTPAPEPATEPLAEPAPEQERAIAPKSAEVAPDAHFRKTESVQEEAGEAFEEPEIIDPHKQSLIEQYRGTCKKRLRDTENQREEAVLIAKRRHISEMRRHKIKNALVVLAYLVAIAALLAFLLHK